MTSLSPSYLVRLSLSSLSHAENNWTNKGKAKNTENREKEISHFPSHLHNNLYCREDSSATRNPETMKKGKGTVPKLTLSVPSSDVSFSKFLSVLSPSISNDCVLSLSLYFFLNSLSVVKTVFRTHSGTFKDGDLLVNKDGLRIVSQNKEEEVWRLRIYVSGNLWLENWILCIADVGFKWFFVFMIEM